MPPGFTDKPFSDFTNPELGELTENRLLNDGRLDEFLESNNPGLKAEIDTFCIDLGSIYAKMDEQMLPSGEKWEKVELPQSYTPVTKERLAGLMIKLLKTAALPSDLFRETLDLCHHFEIPLKNPGQYR